MITTQGRLFRGITVAFKNDEIHISWIKLEPGESIAILIDRTRNNARLYAPLDECRALAAQHHYELVVPQQLGETLLSHAERLLNLLS